MISTLYYSLIYRKCLGIMVLSCFLIVIAGPSLLWVREVLRLDV